MRGQSFGAALFVFPAACPEQSRGAQEPGKAADYRRVQPQPRETVLLVEDEAPVREFVRRTLEHAGYRVVEAENPNQALQTLEVMGGRVDLVLTDVVMPGMSGRMMAERLINRYPRLRILFMSGNAEIVDLLNRARDVRCVMLSKPFTPTLLIERVTEALHARAAA
jgi:two-component system, cell cycle sensor histidine kinase and response regulator CckA